MDDYINRQAPIEAAHREIFNFFDICEDDEESPITYMDERLLELNKAITVAITEIPSADVEQVRHGRWVGYPECLKYTNAYSDDHIVCSVCEECYSILDNDCGRFNYCPNCGARMDKK